MWSSPGLDVDDSGTYWHDSQGRSCYPLSPPLGAHLPYSFAPATNVGVSDHPQFYGRGLGEEHIDNDALPGTMVAYLANGLTWL